MLRSLNKLVYPVTLLLALTLTACGGGGSGGSTTPVKPTPPPTKADLSALTLSEGSLSPSFQAATESYTTSVGLAVNSITVTPTAVETAATITVNGADVTTGTTSAAIPLVEGANTVTVVVTHPDLVKTYTLAVTRLSASAFAEQARKSGAGVKQVAIDENTLAVGSPSSNTVTIYFNDGSGAWLPQQVITALNSDASDEFGNSVSLTGNTLIVGAPGEDSSAKGINGDDTNNDANGSGAAYIFTRSGAIWAQQAYLKASNARENATFGGRVVVSGDTAIVGSVGEKNTGENDDQFGNLVPNSGAAYVFNRTGSSWAQTNYLKASNIVASKFGRDIAIAGDTMAISAFQEDSNTGAVYIFTRPGSSTAWSQQARLAASNAETGDLFGISLDLDGNTLAVGAFDDSVNNDPTDNQANAAGAAYIFTGSGSSWTQQAYLKSATPEIDGQFGISIGLLGDEITVGAQGEEANAGTVHFFTRSGSAWTQQSPIKPSTIGAGNKFGSSLSYASNGNLAIAAENEGIVYIFQQ